MTSGFSRGFRGRRRTDDATAARLPPGQYVEGGFPVLSAGPTPRINLADWSLEIDGLVERPQKWSWEEIHALPGSTYNGDIHCVTQWTKFDTTFSGVSVDTLLKAAGPLLQTGHVLVSSYGGYTTNLTLADITGGKAWVVWDYDGGPLPAEHGGPARLLVPALYFWKSAKWVTRLTVSDRHIKGFWEVAGYHDHGDPWLEQRYDGD